MPFLKRLAGNDADAEDALQDAAVRYLEVQDVQHARTWIERTAKNFLVMEVRHQKVIVRLSCYAPRPARPTSAEDLAILDQTLGRMRPDRRRLVVSRYLEGMSTREVAAEQGLTEPTVKIRIFYAVQENKGDER